MNLSIKFCEYLSLAHAIWTKIYPWILNKFSRIQILTFSRTIDFGGIIIYLNFTIYYFFKNLLTSIMIIYESWYMT